jgi:hypothetical protein
MGCISRALTRAGLGLVCLVGFGSAALASEGTREVNFFPVLGGDSDIGFGGGGAGNLAELVPGTPPYRWRLDAAAFVTFQQRAGRGLVLPFEDYNLNFVVPRLGPQAALRLETFVAFTDEQTLRYYGIGNASPPQGEDESILSLEYRRLHPTGAVAVRANVVRSFNVVVGTSFTFNRLEVPADTRLAQQQMSGPPEVRALLGSFDPHAVQLLTMELQWDARDDDSITRAGQFHTLRFRASPHVGSAMPYEYQRVTMTSRFYASSKGGHLHLLSRLVGDLLFNDPPFYELARFDETPAIGGGKAVRGVPAQRYYGKVKVFGNLEAIADVRWFTAWNKPFVLGVATFLDAGRTWAELGKTNPALDGPWPGIKYGVGGGLRLQEGRTFIVRVDVAWSPDATPIGAYFNAGQVF